MDALIANPQLLAATVLLLAIAWGFVFWAWGRRRYRRAAEDLADELHRLAGKLGEAGRISVEGRSGALVDLADGINGLLDQIAAKIRAGERRESLFDALAAMLPEVALIHTDTIDYANPAAAALFGLEPEQLRGKAFTDLFRPAYRAMLRKRIGTELTGDQALEPIEVQLISGEERGLWAELHSRRIDYRGSPAFITVARDITPRKSLQASLDRGKLQARVTLESIGEGVITTDRGGAIDYMNEASEQLIGVTRSAALGKQLLDLIALVDEVDGESLGDPVRRCMTERRRVNLGRRALLSCKQSSREFSVELTASPIRGPDHEPAGCVVIFHDVTELRGLAREMSYQASHDALTGLVNRLEFERRLGVALKSVRGEGAGHVVCYLDLDRFKVVNDTCGHVAGDNLLREISSLLKQEVRDSDTVARVGGDEFAMLLTGCPLDKARQIADDVCRAVGEYRFSWQGRAFDIGISIGLVEVGPASVSAESVLNAADSACYVAKRQGRGRVHVYSARDELLARERGEIQWLKRIQNALKENSFELYVQPIVAVAGRVDSGPAAEVLIRMRDESGKLILPASFLSAAERYQLMSHIDRWVVQAALTALASGVPHLPEGRTCGINISGQSLADEEFLGFVVDLLDHTGVPPSKICFEVNESVLINNIEHARRFINVLHGMGCQFAMDNFGSGVGSFAKLQLLSLDYLKIDGAYTRNLEKDSINREMVAALIGLSRRLNFRVVAEQIEDQESFDAIREMGVEFAQGNLVERPRPLRTTH